MTTKELINMIREEFVTQLDKADISENIKTNVVKYLDQAILNSCLNDIGDIRKEKEVKQDKYKMFSK